ncbi:MAG: hypothetical protein R3D59_10400 [Paracoccaceae bacterium]
MELLPRCRAPPTTGRPTSTCRSTTGWSRDPDRARRLRRSARNTRWPGGNFAGSQYGHLKSFRTTGEGTFIDGVKVSDVTLTDLALDAHRSIWVEDRGAGGCHHPGGINIFGRGSGNYDQDILRV